MLAAAVGDEVEPANAGCASLDLLDGTSDAADGAPPVDCIAGTSPLESAEFAALAGNFGTVKSDEEAADRSDPAQSAGAASFVDPEVSVPVFPEATAGDVVAISRLAATWPATARAVSESTAAVFFDGLSLVDGFADVGDSFPPSRGA